MHRESFTSPEIARILNTSFIPIKLDRDERPDLDRIYMNYVQATSGTGGWPLSVFLTPDLAPLFGGTYWPGPGSELVARGHIGFQGIAARLAETWSRQRERCIEDAAQVTEALRRFSEEGTLSHGTGANKAEDDAQELDIELLEDAYDHFAARYDTGFGGFSKAPKFPTSPNLRFLLRLGQYPAAVRDVVGSDECKHAAEMALDTLAAMAKGGIHDQLGKGYARYSVTRDWSLPHFEKMLYDQALLLHTFLDATLVCLRAEAASFRDRAPAMLAQVLDVADYLTSPPILRPEGGFFTAEDADSLYRAGDEEKREGAFYVWTLKELQTILGDRDSQVVARYYGIEENGNVAAEHDAHDELINQNVLVVSATEEALAREFGLARDDVRAVVRAAKRKLRAHRDRDRPRPALDDKLVVAWNGLAIGALARAAATLQALDPNTTAAARYLAAAEKAASFIKAELWDAATGSLQRVWRGGASGGPSFASDYAFLTAGLLELYSATFDDGYLSWADALQAAQLARFWDGDGSASGGLFDAEAERSDLILRLKDGMDGAEPAANGVAAQNLLRLGALLDDETYAARARATLAAFAPELLQHPFLFVGLLDALVGARLGMRALVVAGEGEAVEAALRRERLGLGANTVVARIGTGARSDAWLRGRNALVAAMDPARSVVQVCQGGLCTEYGDGDDQLDEAAAARDAVDLLELEKLAL